MFWFILINIATCKCSILIHILSNTEDIVKMHSNYYFFFFLVHLVCIQGEIRLRGGSNAMTGRVEVCNNGIWGTVCDDVWGARDAQVACRQLTYASTGEISALAVSIIYS